MAIRDRMRTSQPPSASCRWIVFPSPSTHLPPTRSNSYRPTSTPACSSFTSRVSADER